MSTPKIMYAPYGKRLLLLERLAQCVRDHNGTNGYTYSAMKAALKELDNFEALNQQGT